MSVFDERETNFLGYLLASLTLAPTVDRQLKLLEIAWETAFGSRLGAVTAMRYYLTRGVSLTEAAKRMIHSNDRMNRELGSMILGTLRTQGLEKDKAAV